MNKLALILDTSIKEGLNMKKIKRFIIFTLLISLVAIPVQAKEKREPKVIFMGTIEEVVKNEEKAYISITAKGYLKGSTVYEEELVGIVSEKTYLIKDKCKDEDANNKKEMVNLKDFKAEKGDKVFMVLDGIMTKSIPPQAPVKAILVNHVEK